MDLDNAALTANATTQNNASQSFVALTLQGLVIFPHTSVHFDIGKDKLIMALEKAMQTNSQVFLVTQKHNNAINLAPKDIYRIGVLATIKQLIRLPNDIVRVVVNTHDRWEIESFAAINPYFVVCLKDLKKPDNNLNEIEAARRELTKAYEQYKKLDLKISAELLKSINTTDPEPFVYSVAAFVFDTDSQKLKILCEPDILVQMQDCIAKIYSEIELLDLEKKIQNQVRQRIDKQQKEYYLREQQKVISDELGENEDEIKEYKEKIEKFGLDDDYKKRLLKDLARLEKTAQASPEYGMLRSYFDTLAELPWNSSSQEEVDIAKAKQILDDDHYGLDKVKDRIIEFLAVGKLTNNTTAPILCFVGPPGVGKTSVVKSIAKAAGRKLVTMSLGGVRDEAEIRGHRRTYIGAIPGRIINGLLKVNVNNPVFLLDEIDKMTADFKGDPSAALLEVLDNNINSAFKDHYIEVPFDISKVVFVTTANSVENVPLPLLDRLELIELSGYTVEEKFEIAKRYLIPKQQKLNGLDESQIVFDDKALMTLIDGYTKESGVRRLEREIGSICRKVAVDIVQKRESKQPTNSTTITDITPYLGATKYAPKELGGKNEIGRVNGMAWTQVGGKLLSVEVTVVSGKGEIRLTGSLGNVMKESCHTAITAIKSRAELFGLDQSLFKDKDFHVHFPEGATPKDGPSAGIAIATALLSAMTGVPVDNSVAMTGEVSLLGNVLAIGGLKEKTLAALRSGIKTIILPQNNKKDIDEIPQSVQQKLDIVWVDTVEEVFERALVKNV